MIHNHVKENYICPICLGVSGVENDDTLIRKGDILYRDEKVMVFIASYFIGKNSGHLIVVPIQHYEHLYDLPDDVGAHIFRISRTMSVAMKEAYQCAGVTTQQNNEPAGGQHAFHYHLYLFPRYENDELYSYMGKKRQTTPEERAEYAAKMKGVLEKKLL